MSRAKRAASWIAEAISTGNPLAELPREISPRSRAEGERVAFLTLDSLGLTPCGLRFADGIAGPMIEGRLLPNGATASPLRHPVITAALIAVLDEPLDPDGEKPPALAALHPALDLADHRFTHPPLAVGQRAADLGGLGFIIAGPPHAPMEAVTVGPTHTALQDTLAPAIAAARRLGGLPRGALLIVAGLSTPLTPDTEGRIALDFGALGMVIAKTLGKDHQPH
ncbi:hypothetical protein [Roseomonas xinghualingensis]|uniref:hypothetical protein n=1 Tax=Roseomonas xinghualingensis TaxID=2986475 RepID=UPI0021F1ABCA|nr:hypothetical protein [Roseomonas sp. SXEYE001]MCV4207855.1 hypothetical protein [Roseomonas sp. SXEYE001]